MQLPIGLVLFIVFLVLKLTEVIDWSWWWIAAPIWIPLALLAFVYSATSAIAYTCYKKASK
ncbi:membrane protein [Mycobacterium phage PainterBoy]|nr:membrane protein [Mycobacterium phage Lucyedi]QNJ55853.1 membrane protein [Mycobacterium phage PainterBoy]